MTRLSAIVWASLLLGAVPVQAQKVPTPADWERLHLRQNWSMYLPIENRADSVQKLQLFDNDIFVQNASGMLVKVDALTGVQDWVFTPPLKKRALYPVTVNEKIVFFINSTNLFFLDRATGKVIFETELGSIPSAGPTSDSERVYIPLISNKTVAYRFIELVNQTTYRPPFQEASRGPQLGLGFTAFEDLATAGNTSPSISLLATLRPPFTLPGIDEQPSLSIPTKVHPPFTMEGSYTSPSLIMVQNLTTVSRLSEIKDRIEPKKIWEQANRFRVGLDLITVEAAGTVVMPAKQGEVYMTGNFVSAMKFQLKTDADISANLGLHDFTVYIPTADTYLYAYDIKLGSLKWREPTGGEVLKAPTATDDALFVVGGGSGLRKLNRANGRVIWPTSGYGRAAAQHVPGDEVLAINGKFVYTVDKRNQMYVIDRTRGLNLSNIDLGSLGVLLPNSQDDRIILAGSDGRMVCLQDRDNRSPVRIKKEAPKPAPPEIMIPPEARKALEPKVPAPVPGKKDPVPKKDEMEKKDVEPKKDEMEKKDVEPKKE